MDVLNIDPIATIANNGPVNHGDPTTVSLLNPVDSSADVTAGFIYSYDFNNDGDFIDPGEAADISSSSRDYTLGSSGNHTVRARIKDKDGGYTDYTTIVEVGVRLVENSDFLTQYSQPLTLASGTKTLRFEFDAPAFDTEDIGSINDSFELALLDEHGRSAVATIGHGRDAFFNWTEGESEVWAGGASYDDTNFVVDVDVSFLPAGTVLTYVARLNNNDSDEESAVEVAANPSQLTYVVESNSEALEAVSQSNGQPIDISALIDVSSEIIVQYSLTTFDAASEVLQAGIFLENIGINALRGPILIAVTAISDPSVRLRNIDGWTPEGIPYIDITSLINDGVLPPDESSLEGILSFYNSSETQFTYRLVVLAAGNQSPVFTSEPGLEVATDQTYQYVAHAVDLDDPILAYSLMAGPAGMTIASTTGAIAWEPESSDAGQHVVQVRVEDGHGGEAIQTYVLRVTNGLPNRPPLISSIPIVDAYIGSEYEYVVTGFDVDGDELDFGAIGSVPTGFSVVGIDDTTARVAWSPDASLVGQLITITLEAADSSDSEDPDRLAARQVFQVRVHEAAGNHAPRFVSQPIEEYVYSTSETPEAYLVGAQVFRATSSGGLSSNFQPYQYSTNDQTNHLALFVGSSSTGLNIQLPLYRGNNVFNYDVPLSVDPLSYAGLNLFFDDSSTPFNPPHTGVGIAGHLAVFAETNGSGGVMYTGAGQSVQSYESTGFDYTLAPYSGAHYYDVGELTASVTAFGVNNVGGHGPYGSFTIRLNPFDYIYKGEAIDPDGDQLTYSLVGETHGAEVDSTTGVLAWQPSSDGTFSFGLRVSDGQGGFADQVFGVEVFESSALGQIKGVSTHLQPIGGRVVVSSDEWLFNNTGFGSS